ncbi:hypothetical protein ACFL7M_09470 [Thermodesulfobacteriota bacterium]
MLTDNHKIQGEYIWDYVFNHKKDGNMENKDIDIIQLLNDKKSYHLEQIERINIAIGALQGKPEKSQNMKISPPRVSWTKEILKTVNENNGLTPVEIRNKIAERGITQALDDNYSSSVYATLSRLTSNGKIKKAEDGKYIKMRQPLVFEEKKEASNYEASP